MPDKPTWCGRLDEIASELRALPDSWVDRGTLQNLLAVGPRRAQQILAPCAARRIGANGLAGRETVISHLERLATGEAAYYERRRRLRLEQQFEALERERKRAVMVQEPAAIVKQEFEDLPEGVSITPGRITVEFHTSQEALEKLLAVAMAASNDLLLFERLATGAK